MIILREELMVPPSTIHNHTNPNLKKSYFLNPQITNQQPLPKPQFNSLSPNPNIIKELSKLINFKGRKIPNDSWKTWVNDLQSTHQINWKKAGIFDAIKASTYMIKRDDELVIKLAHFWNPNSNTFVFPWGECTITLEDVMILGGFSVLGESVLDLTKCGNFDEIHANLVNCCLEIKRKNNYHVPFNEWMKLFKGKGDDLENVGLIVQWLSRYVFCVNQFDVDVNSFGFAISLSQGNKIALAPAVLASIYRDLSLLKAKIVAFNDGVCDNDANKSKLFLWSPLQLVQVWAWERFSMLSPKPKGLVVGEPRVSRWHDVYKVKVDGLGVSLEVSGGGFLWRPYVKDVENWEFPKFYSEEGIVVVMHKEVDEEWVSFARCVGVSELVGMDCVEQYLPHRVGMQFGFDQDIASFVPRMNDDLKLAWSSYDKPLDDVELYIPPRLCEGEVTEQYSKLWVRVSPPQGDSVAEPEKKRRRKRESSKLKAKKVPASSSSQGCVSTSDFGFFGSGKDMSMAAKSASFKIEEAEPESFYDVETGSRIVFSSSQSVNLIDKIDSAIAANEGVFLKEPFQGTHTERSSSVPAEDFHRKDAAEVRSADRTESINEFNWCHDYELDTSNDMKLGNNIDHQC